MPLMSLFFCALALLASACQDYAYEEQPNTVVREKRKTFNTSVAQEANILFVVDNSGSMAGEQAQLGQSFSAFRQVLDEKFGPGKYKISVITTGMESDNCPQCNDTIKQGCINETGENGRFQDRKGCVWEGGSCQPSPSSDQPTFNFIADPSCRVVDSTNQNCFYDSTTYRGTVMVGTSGCGYERGLAAMRKALESNLTGSYNSGFLDPQAVLTVAIISDEEDCGEVGDVDDLTPSQATICYYAAKGVGPMGENIYPGTNKPYALTPVQDYYDFLMSLKDGKTGMVKFAAIVGVKDKNNPDTTTIEYENATQTSQARQACTTPPPCSSTRGYCGAFPGTRYIELYKKFAASENGFLDTICQNDFHDTLLKFATFIACPEFFGLDQEILDPALANLILNGKSVPKYTCTSKDPIIECQGLDDTTSCPSGTTCVETWKYCPLGTKPDKNANGPVTCVNETPDDKYPGGKIGFANHYDPCTFITQGEINIELVYVPE
jgi:hypothetical protein